MACEKQKGYAFVAISGICKGKGFSIVRLVGDRINEIRGMPRVLFSHKTQD